MDWSARQYVKFEDERTRPVRDLLAALPASAVRRAADLGCGPANSTELLASAFPQAAIVGIDSSPDMIAEARRRLPGAEFRLAGIETWDDPGPWDLLFANAALQWVPDHEGLLPRLLGKLAEGGSLAVQMPDNLEEPTHRLMRALAAEAPWAAKLGEAAAARTALPGAEWYYRLLRPLCGRVDVWRTTYHHPLAGGAEGVVEWLQATGLRPFLSPLDEPERASYLARYRDLAGQAYPALPDGSVLLPFPRLFLVATR
ncbi:MAG TPA: trans-aconitate 2-methyltransferase [Acetobacteraceae bacterium]|nr:trans-aconitate 2-methyltransferase [Acetobacteraceae bacterium]